MLTIIKKGNTLKMPLTIPHFPLHFYDKFVMMGAILKDFP